MLKMKVPGKMSYLALLNCNKKNHNRKKKAEPTELPWDVDAIIDCNQVVVG